MESDRYEFNQSHNHLIKDLAQKMRFVSYFLIALGVLLIIGGIVSVRSGLISGIINGVLQILIGFWTTKAASSFNLIADTQGNDIENLMIALEQLRKLYTLQYWLILIALIFIVIALITGLILGAVNVTP